MKKEQIIERCLNLMEDITKSTATALQTLENNANTVNILMDELFTGAVSSYDIGSNNISFDSNETEELKECENIDEMADKLAKLIQEQADLSDPEQPAVVSIGIPIDLDDDDVAELMNKVNIKLSGETDKKEEKEDTFNEAIDFDNPLK